MPSRLVRSRCLLTYHHHIVYLFLSSSSSSLGTQCTTAHDSSSPVWRGRHEGRGKRWRRKIIIDIAINLRFVFGDKIFNRPPRRFVVVIHQGNSLARFHDGDKVNKGFARFGRDKIREKVDREGGEEDEVPTKEKSPQRRRMAKVTGLICESHREGAIFSSSSWWW